ncbi:MAG: sulfatase [Planctomycetaceae bacterium]|nr:sulfatase [Planctomycetaceae bacterium]
MSDRDFKETPADPLEGYLRNLTRRRFFGSMAGGVLGGLGATALGSLVGDRPAFAGSRVNEVDEILATLPHHAPKAKRVIYMHMEGAPSQLDLYDYKPALHERFDEDLPNSIRNGQRITTMTSGQARFPVAPTAFKFDRYENNEDGVMLSEILPHTGRMAKDICFIRSMHTSAINHEPGITFFQTGSEIPGRPCFGSWMSYGLGSMNSDLPTFVVMITQGIGNMQALSARFWGSGFLPSEHQGCKLRAGRDAVLHLRDPDGVSREDRRLMLDLAAKMNEEEFAESLDPEVQARIAQYEMAYRMQMSVPELTDISDESEETLAMYGPDVRTPGSFAANCLQARRLSERGVRFIQLYMRGWDQHGNLPGEIRAQAKAVDQPQAALLKDLKQRGMLDETLVLWAGEFGRTVYSQGNLTRENYGRDHHPRCFTVWLAGGGIKPGISYGKTDDFSYNIVENPVEVHDLHATMLHQLGLDHEKTIYRHQGRDYRLTDVHGRVVKDILA